jgi:hypothetical protein
MKVGHGPVLRGLADANEEVAHDIGAALGVKHLGMELDAVEIALQVLDGGELGVIGRADRGKARRQLDQAVAMRVPDPELPGQTGKEPAGFLDRQRAMAVLAVIAAQTLPPSRWPMSWMP